MHLVFPPNPPGLIWLSMPCYSWLCPMQDFSQNKAKCKCNKERSCCSCCSSCSRSRFSRGLFLSLLHRDCVRSCVPDQPGDEHQHPSPTHTLCLSHMDFSPPATDPTLTSHPVEGLSWPCPATLSGVGHLCYLISSRRV